MADAIAAPLEAQADAVLADLAARGPLVFLDYDGTLAPIVADPDRAFMTDAMRAAVGRLARLAPVALVSGRGLDRLRTLAALDGVVYAGSHGFEIAGPGVAFETGAPFLPALDAAEARLRPVLAAIPGARLERKRYALAAHYREIAAADVGRVEAAVAAALTEGGGRLRRSGGKKVFELRPALDWDKGRAVGWLIDAAGFGRPGAVPVYVGDDETDEDAFRALRGRGVGIAVQAEPRPTAAAWRLPDTEAVRRFLEALADRLDGVGPAPR